MIIIWTGFHARQLEIKQYSSDRRREKPWHYSGCKTKQLSWMANTGSVIHQRGFFRSIHCSVGEKLFCCWAVYDVPPTNFPLLIIVGKCRFGGFDFTEIQHDSKHPPWTKQVSEDQPGTDIVSKGVTQCGSRTILSHSIHGTCRQLAAPQDAPNYLMLAKWLPLRWNSKQLGVLSDAFSNVRNVITGITICR